MENKRLRTLKTRADFERLRKTGRRVYPTDWLLVSFITNDLTYNRYGWTVSRQVGSSVTRNRLKRWCREFFRSSELGLQSGLDINVVFKASKKEFFRTLPKGELDIALEKACKLIIKRP